MLIQLPKLEEFRLKKILYWGLAVGAAIGTSIKFFDQSLAAWFGHPEQGNLWLAARHITEIGDADTYFAIAVGSILITQIFPKSWGNQALRLSWLNKGIFLLISLASSGVITHALKFTVGRQRPHKSPVFDNLIFEPFNTHWHMHSFPSGHTQTLFVVYAFFLYAFPHLRRATKIFLFIFFFAMAFTRVMTDAHFLSDVLGGMYVGWASTWIVHTCIKNYKFGKYY